MLLTFSSFSDTKLVILGRLDTIAARAFAMFSLERFCPRVLLPMSLLCRRMATASRHGMSETDY